MTWYKKVLKENKKEIASSAAFAIVFALAVLLWHFAFGKSFQWENISPVEAPGLLPRLFYSALVYISLGAILYTMGFYKVLYSLFRGVHGGYLKYKDTKALIWRGLILAMYFVIVPFVVDVLNTIISFFYNILNLVLYIFPPLGASFIVFSIGYIIFKKVKNTMNA